MENIKTEIKRESSRAAKLSQEAKSAFAVRDLATGKVLMKQAVEASKNCQNLIEQLLVQSQSQNG